MKEAIRHSEEHLRTLLDNTSDVILMLDLDGRITYYNGPVCYAATNEDLRGKTAYDLFPLHEADILDRQLRHVIQTGERSVIEVSLTWNGGVLWSSDHAFPIRDPEGRITGVAKICRNITHIKNAAESLRRMHEQFEHYVAVRTRELEEANERLRREIEERQKTVNALRGSEMLLRALTDHATDIIAINDAAGKILYCSPASRQILGYEPEELIGRYAFGFFYPPDIERLRELYATAIETSSPQIARYRIIRKNGTCVWVESTLQTLINPTNGETESVIITRDITEQQQAVAILNVQRDLAISLSVSKELGKAMKQMLDTTICGIEGIDCGGVYAIDEATHELNLVCHRGLSPEFISAVSHFDGDSVQSRLIREGKPLYISTRDIYFDIEACRIEGILAQASIPVFHKGQVIAAMNLASRTVDEFPLVIRSGIEGIAPQIGAAIERIRSRESLQRAHDELEKRVAERTIELNCQAAALQSEIVDRKRTEEALRKSEERYRTLAETAQDSIFIIDRDDRVEYVNSYAATRFHAKPEDLIGCRRDTLFPPEIAERQRKALLRVLDTGEAESTVDKTVFPFGVQWLATQLTALHDQHGNVRAVLGISRDFTDLKNTEEALRVKEEKERVFRRRLTTLLDITNQLSQIETLHHLCRRAVELGRSRLGFDRLGIWLLSRDEEQLIGTYGTDEAGKTRDERGRTLPNTGPMKEFLARFPHELVFKRMDRQLLDDHARAVGQGTHVTTAIWDGKKIMGLLGADNLLKQDPFSDYDCELLYLYASTLGHLYSRINTQTQHITQVRKLTKDAEQNLENERSRISRELHDELGQLLTALNMDLAWIERHTGTLQASASDRIATMKDIVKKAVTSIRDLSKSLRPPIIEHEGLTDAIRSYVTDYKKRTGIQCRVTIKPEDIETSGPVVTVLYRILQESLTNVARHSQASRCEISLRAHNDMLELKIQDNGVGAGLKEIKSKDTLGIVGMRERASSVGGNVALSSRSGKGFCVTAKIPWQREQTQRDGHD